jgi:PAS domain S-box-containing protein
VARLLIIDDNELNRAVLARRLERRGHQVLTAADAAAGGQLAVQAAPDAVLLDLRLRGERDGWALAAALRADETTRRTTILAFATAPTPAEADRAWKEGCDACLPKPLDLPTLQATLDRLLRERGIELPEAGPAAPPVRKADDPPLLLVVDDEELNREMLQRRLERRGYRVRTGGSGTEALAELAEERVDLVLLDVMMPGMTGLEVLRRIREVFPAAALPVIMATARSGSTEIVDALEGGANDYVTKPLDFPVVLARVQTQLGLRAANEAARSSDAHFRHLAESSPDLITRQTPDGTFLYVSPAARVLLGYDPAELVGRNAHDLVHADDFADLATRLSVDDVPGQLSVTCRLARRDGTHLWFEIAYRLLRDPRTGDIAEMQATYRNVSGQVLEREERFERIVSHLAWVTETRRDEPDGHVHRVGRTAELLALRYGQGAVRADLIRRAAMFHDFGNIMVPPAWLRRRGRLTEEEMAVVRTHTTLGHEMLRGSGSELLDLAAVIALNHHERHDGSGYPRNRRGRSIPLEARIVGIADMFDALTSERPWRHALTADEAWEIVHRSSGVLFDPELVEYFGAILPEVVALRGSTGGG